MNKSIEIPYDKNQIKFELPSSWDLIKIITPKGMPAVRDEKEVIENAIRKPLDTKSLVKIAEGKKTAVILSDDKARPTPSDKIIPILLDELNTAGIKDEEITVVIGRGLHPSLNQLELMDKLGKETLQRVRVVDHNADNTMINLGKTSFRIPVLINKHVANADVKIGLGSIMPHELAGFTGGAGIVVPGVAGRETINKNHSLVSSFNAEFGNINGNKIREDMEEAARIAKMDIIVNTILNTKEEIAAVVAGDIVNSHRKGIEIAKKIFGVKIPRKADISVASSFPRDTSFGKAMKAIFSADIATKPDGTIILVSPCTDGISHSDVFKEMLLQNLGREFLFKLLRKGELPGESCVLYLFEKIKRKKSIFVVSDGLNSDDVEKIGLNYASSIEEAFQMTNKKEATVNILPLGSVTLPISN